jgi:hypothetical protein
VNSNFEIYFHLQGVEFDVDANRKRIADFDAAQQTLKEKYANLRDLGIIEDSDKEVLAHFIMLHM